MRCDGAMVRCNGVMVRYDGAMHVVVHFILVYFEPQHGVK